MFVPWVSLSLAIFTLPVFAPKPPQDFSCDPVFFGRPENQDCKNALANLPDWEAMSEDGSEDWGIIREFANVDGPGRSGTTAEEHIVRTPFVHTSGE